MPVPKKNLNNAVIYALLEPTTRKPRYVGCTNFPIDERLRLHWSSRFGRTAHLAKWMQELPVPPQIIELEIVLDPIKWDAEEYWITLLRQIDTVKLLNVANRRSNPLPGKVTPEEVRKKISESLRGRKVPPEKIICGERCASAKLTEDQVQEIRQAPGSVREIGAQFGVSRQTISMIKRRLAWAHVPDKPTT
jgi:hypothetical protein